MHGIDEPGTCKGQSFSACLNQTNGLVDLVGERISELTYTPGLDTTGPVTLTCDGGILGEKCSIDLEIRGKVLAVC